MQRAPADFLGRQSYSGKFVLPRHGHRAAYVCVVLAGAYEEAGDCGRIQLVAGDVVFHPPFDAHLDRFSASGAETLSFEIDGWNDRATVLAKVPNLDMIIQLSERDPFEAREQLLAGMVQARNAPRDWPDELAQSIRDDPSLSLTRWARSHRLDPATLSRGFRRVYQVSPVTFRARIRAHQAWRTLQSVGRPLSEIASEYGYCDQPHMTRAVRALTGITPAQWRHAKSSKFKT